MTLRRLVPRGRGAIWLAISALGCGQSAVAPAAAKRPQTLSRAGGVSRCKSGARGESRTLTPLPARDFESRVSAIPPLGRQGNIAGQERACGGGNRRLLRPHFFEVRQARVIVESQIFLYAERRQLDPFVDTVQ